MEVVWFTAPVPDEDLVTVVIPSFNEEMAISSCLDSILAQTHRNLEVLVSDGGSTDRTRDIELGKLAFYR